MTTKPKKMTKEEWDSIVDICIVDDERMALYRKLEALNEKFLTQDVSFADVNLWSELKERLVAREWQILIERGKIVRSDS